MSDKSEREHVSSNNSFIDENFYAESSETINSSFSDSTDYRFFWIREKIMNFLGLSDLQDIFNDLMNNNRGYYKKKLHSLLNVNTFEIQDLEYKQVFFYKTYRDEIVQDEISVWEGHTKIATLESYATQVKSQRLVKSAPNVKKKKGKNKKTAKNLKSKSQESIKSDESIIHNIESPTALGSDWSIGSREGQEEAEDGEESFDSSIDRNNLELLMKNKSEPIIKENYSETEIFIPPPRERHKYVLTKKLVERSVRVPVLHCFFGEIDGSNSQLSDQQLIYLLRSKDSAIPVYESEKECWADFPRHILVGSIQGQFLPTMNQLLKNVFLPLAEKQFHENNIIWEKFGNSDIEKNVEIINNLIKFQGEDFIPASIIRRSTTLIKKKKIEKKIQEQSSINKSIDINESHDQVGNMKFREDLSNLIESVEWAMDHIESETLLTIPDVLDAIDPRVNDNELAKYKTLVQQLEEIVISWKEHFKKVLDMYLNKSSNKSPMIEYKYWHDCESGTSLLVAQSTSAAIVKTINILKLAKSSKITGFEFLVQELSELYNTAADNNKFLSTVLRYFMILEETTSFDEIIRIIPGIYEHLRMIWILSKYYGLEENMVSLIEKLSWQIRQNFIKNLQFKKLFNEPLETILTKMDTAHRMLKLWKSTYLNVRSSIEQSGKGARWEFDQQRLFKDTDYLGMVASNLYEIVDVTRDFNNIFGEELKSIVDDPAHIDSIVERINELLKPIINAESDAFNEFNRDNWEATMTWFRVEAGKFEAEAELFIDKSFRALIKAEDALAMLMKFRSMKTRESIQQKLATKFDVIIQQFSKEVNEVEHAFNKNKRNPPASQYFSPIAGAIFWERQLFYRLKNSVVILNEIEEIRTSDQKTFAYEQYVILAQQMKNYEDDKYDTFVKTANPILQASMRRNILTLVASEKKPANSRMAQAKALKMNSSKKLGSGDYVSIGTVVTNRADDKTNSMVSNISNSAISRNVRQSQFERKFGSTKSIKSKLSSGSNKVEKFQQQIMKNVDLMRGAILLENQMKLTVNFNTDVFKIIREAELIEQLGFTLPSSIREIAIQKYRLYENYDAVKNMINEYNNIIDQFDEADILLLKNVLHNVEKQIQPGIMRLNWHSLNINNYTLKCMKLLKNITSIVTQINQIRRELDDKIENVLSRFNLFTMQADPNDPGYELQTCKEFFANIEIQRSDLVTRMLKCYQTMNPLLRKLEYLVEGTATGRSSAMLLYYEYYEQKIFSGFITCYIRNLEYLKNILTTNKPIFYVDAIILLLEVELQPSAAEIYKIIMNSVKNLMQRMKIFPRWMSGTSIECEPILNDTKTKFIIFSFFEDVMSIQVINALISMIQDKLHRLIQDCWRYLNKWKEYINIWAADKHQICAKFISTNPTLQQYIEKFDFYDSIMDEINDMPEYQDIFSIRINLKPLLQSIKEHTLEWKRIYGNYLHEETVEAMNNLKNTMINYTNKIELIINSLERFKIVMQSINDIKHMAIQTQIQYLQYQETFRLFRTHNLEFLESEELLAQTLETDWTSLYLGALYRFNNLDNTKDQYCSMTVKQIEDFKCNIADFVDNFYKNGPGNCGQNLDLGTTKMEEFGLEINYLQQMLDDLQNAELLFDLPCSDYSNFNTVKNEYESMEKIFEMYKSQKMSRDIWAKTLWKDLNPVELINGMDHYLKEFRKMPLAARNLTVGQTLEMSMKSFKNSVPLFVELKNEAMRERHWKELMDRTGKHFDMSADRFA